MDMLLKMNVVRHHAPPLFACIIEVNQDASEDHGEQDQGQTKSGLNEDESEHADGKL